MSRRRKVSLPAISGGTPSTPMCSSRTRCRMTGDPPAGGFGATVCASRSAAAWPSGVVAGITSVVLSHTSEAAVMTAAMCRRRNHAAARHPNSSSTSAALRPSRSCISSMHAAAHAPSSSAAATLMPKRTATPSAAPAARHAAKSSPTSAERSG